MLNAHVAFTLLFFGTEAVIPERFFGDTDEHNVEYTHRGFLRITTSHNVLLSVLQQSEANKFISR